MTPYELKERKKAVAQCELIIGEQEALIRLKKEQLMSCIMETNFDKNRIDALIFSIREYRDILKGIEMMRDTMLDKFLSNP